MTEPATLKPFLSRRRVIAGAVVVLVIVAVAFVGFEALREDSKEMIRVRIVGFKGQHPAPVFALVTVSNVLMHPNVILTVWPNGQLEADFIPGSFTNCATGDFDISGIGTSAFDLNPSETRKGIFELPLDGRVGRIAVSYYLWPRSQSRLVQDVRELLWIALPSKRKIQRAISDQWIQCPKLLPNGTVEPPRLISAPGAKP